MLVRVKYCRPTNTRWVRYQCHAEEHPRKYLEPPDDLDTTLKPLFAATEYATTVLQCTDPVVTCVGYYAGDRFYTVVDAVLGRHRAGLADVTSGP